MKIKITKYFLMIGLFCVCPLVVTATSTIIRQGFGANVHLQQRIAPENWNAVLEQAQNTGVQWGREEFNWDTIEPVDDQYNWNGYDTVIDNYEQHDIQVLGLLTYSSAWASTSASSNDYRFYPPDLTAWQDYVGTVAEHYSDSIDYWEIWNEPNNSGFWKSDAVTYATYLAAAASAIKAHNPQAQIVLGGLSGADTNFLNDVYQALSDKNIINVIAIHPYRLIENNFNYAPEDTQAGLNTLLTDLYNVKAVVQRYQSASTPIWLTEVGWTSAANGVSEATQADYLTRLYTLALNTPQITKVFWYTLTDTANDLSNNEANFGLLKTDFTPKIAAQAYTFTKQTLEDHYLGGILLPKAWMIDDFSKSSAWKFTDTKCTSGFLNDSADSQLIINYQFTGKNNCYAPVVLNKPLPDDTQVIQFKALGNNDDTILRLRVIDNKGETFQYNLGYLPGEWLTYTVQLRQYAAQWGGNNNSVVDQPVTFNGFVLDDTDGSKAQGTIKIDQLTASPKAFLNIYRLIKNDRFSYAFWGVKKSRKFTITLADSNGAVWQSYNGSTADYAAGTTQVQRKSSHTMQVLEEL